MSNTHVISRLEGTRQMLIGVHKASASASSATKGTERAEFLNSYLAESLPSIYRFGSGDITDTGGNRSGQIDIVIEHPFAPNLPLQSGQPRLYLAEGIAAAVEVKSNVASQWQQVMQTAHQLTSLRRKFAMTMSMGGTPLEFVPLFVAGYTGWQTLESVRSALGRAPETVAAVLIIDPGLYVSRLGTEASGPLALWGLICDLYRVTSMLQSASTDPAAYVT